MRDISVFYISTHTHTHTYIYIYIYVDIDILHVQLPVLSVIFYYFAVDASPSL